MFGAGVPAGGVHTLVPEVRPQRVGATGLRLHSLYAETNRQKRGQ